MTTRKGKYRDRNWENAMPFIPIPFIAQVELIYLWDVQVCQTVLHYDAPNDPAPADFTSFAVSLKGIWDIHLKPLMPGTLALTGIKITDMSTANGPTILYSAGMPIAGTTGQPSLPNNCAVAITKRTVLRGRSFRGRIFHPGLQENVVAANQVTAAHMTALLAAYTQFLTVTVGAHQYDMHVVSRYSNNVPRASGIRTRVESLSSDGVIDSQRRRLPGRGA